MPVAARLMPATVAEPEGEPDRDRVPPDHGEPDPMPARWPGPGFERSSVLSRSVALIPVVVLTLAGAGAFVNGKLVERPEDEAAEAAQPEAA